jgi:hypothetical protein
MPSIVSEAEISQVVQDITRALPDRYAEDAGQLGARLS